MLARLLSILGLAATLWLAAPGDARAEKNIPLIIGHSGHKDRTQPPHPTNDAAAMSAVGHGMEVDGGNGLVRVDAALARDIDVEDEAISLDRVVRTLEPAKRLRLVTPDACRDNPFTRSMKRTLGTRAVARGLAKIELAT